MQRYIVLISLILFATFLGPARTAVSVAPHHGKTENPVVSPAEPWVTHANADHVTVLHAQGDRLWAGSRWGGLIGWNVANLTLVQRLYPQGGLAGNQVTAITTAPNDQVWVATTGGVSLYLADGTPVENFTFKNTSRRLDQRAVVQKRALTGERHIRLDLTSEPDVLSAFAPGYLMFGTDETIYFYRGWDEANQTVVISPELHQTVEPGTPVYAVDVGVAADAVRDVAVDHAGRAWISTVNGVSVYNNGRWTVYTQPYYPLVSNDAGAMAVDGAGRVWISHEERGQFTMFDGQWHTYSIAGTIQSLTVNPDDGSVWAATNRLCDATGTCRGGGVWAFNGAAWQQRYRASDGIADEKVDSIAFGAAGRLWLGHELTNRVAVSRRVGNGWQIYQTVQQTIEADFHNILTTQTANDLWAVVSGRVWTRHLGAVRGYAPGIGWQALYTGDVGLNSNETRALAADEAGRVWVGAEPMFDGRNQVGGGVNLWDGEQWTHYTAENTNLPDNMVTEIAVGRGNVWVKTRRDQFSHFADGVWTPFDDITDVVESDYWSIIDSQDMAGLNDNRLWTVDDAGRIWVWSSGQGVKYYKPDTGWVSYTFENTLRKQEPAATYLQMDAHRLETFIWVSAEDIPDSAAAQSRFSSGFLMVGDDPTIYRYESFQPHPREDISGLQISPRLQTSVTADTPVYAIDVGLLSNAVSDVTVGPAGHIWLAARPARVGPTSIYGGVVMLLDAEAGTWIHYTVRNTSQRGAAVGHVTADALPGDTQVPADFENASAADQALSSGFVMFEDDPTLYRYLGFNDDGLIIKPIFNSTKYEAGVQQGLPAGTQIHAVELGLLGTPQGDSSADRLAVDHTGRMWIAVRDVGISVLEDAALPSGAGPSEWMNYRREDGGLASARISGMVARGGEMWVWTDGGGISVFHNGEWRTYDVFNSGLVGNEVEALTITANGEAWMATHDRGISVLTLPGFRLDTGVKVVLAQPDSTAKTSFEVAFVGGFNGRVALSVEGLPPGIDATFTPASVDSGGTVELALEVSDSVAVGSYPVTVTGRGPDGLTATRRLTLHVVPSVRRAYIPLIARSRDAN